ncbi:MAG: hypothetical protein COB15_06345 [Flavobacteriales bacterium]|nr:MAG: hypothetical protein COB15_06345 [Flavobacteriales bacterium]
MKKIIPIIIISFFFTSCDWHLGKTSDMESLLDYGFSDQPTKDVSSTESTDSPSTFKSTGTKHLGMDISHWQGDIMAAYKASNDLSFVICKATGGDYFVDPDFRNNWNEIKEKGLIRGAYHFYLCAFDPITQAEHFCTTISDIDAKDIAPILDIEQGSMSKDVSGEQMAEDILVFLKEVEKKTNRKPILYTDYAFAQEYLKSYEFANYDLWLAEYTTDGDTPMVPDVWKEKGYKIWQKSASYHIDTKTVDLDQYSGPLSEIVK